MGDMRPVQSTFGRLAPAPLPRRVAAAPRAGAFHAAKAAFASSSLRSCIVCARPLGGCSAMSWTSRNVQIAQRSRRPACDSMKVNARR